MKIILHIILVLSFASCATIRDPEGGPLDSAPPVADSLHATPGFGALHVNSKEIEIPFNEYVQLKNPKQVLISPAQKENPDIKIRGKKLYITLKDELLPATTYTISLGTAVQDITEGNAAGKLDMIFSTGDYIDSLQVTGKVTDAFTLEPMAETGVLLYRDTSKNTVRTSKPDYYTITGKDGRFSFGHLSPGLYRFISVKDANNNFYWDQPQESVGYVDSLFNLTENTDVGNIVSAPQAGAQKPPKADWNRPGVISLPITDFPIELFIDDTTAQPTKTTVIPGTDSAFVWLAFPLPDSLTLYTRFENDTVWASRTIRNTVKVKSKVPPLNFRNPPQFLEDTDTLKIYASQPILKINQELIVLTTDTLVVPFKVILDSVSCPHFKILFDAVSGKSYKLKLKQGSVEDWNQTKSDSALFVVSTRKEGYYGAFELKIIGEPGVAYVAQLLNSKGKIIDQIRFVEIGQLSNTKLLPESYKVRLIKDENNNGRWDSGDFELDIQPEKVTYYPDAISIKSKWELDLEWNLLIEEPQKK